LLNSGLASLRSRPGMGVHVIKRTALSLLFAAMAFFSFLSK